MSESTPAQPEILTKTMLGTTATYRVLGRTDGGDVRVTVIEAPGLEPGFEFTITAEAAAGMDGRAAQRGDAKRAGVSVKAAPATPA